MKHLTSLLKPIIILSSIFILQTVHGQKLKTNLSINNPDNTLHFYITDFERNYSSTMVTDSINPWVIDITNSENIWQIGKPQKQGFDSAVSLPNVIITDTINTYPINNYSSFQINLKKPQWAIWQGRGWSSVSLYFQHKFNTDSLYDGGYIDVSYDGGVTFTNIILDDHYSEHYIEAYSENDTISEGIPAFTGSSGAEWIGTQIALRWEEKDYYEVDSMIIRFNFKSDGIDTQKEGWIIDDIYCEVKGYFPSNSELNKTTSAIKYYPNPTKNKLNLCLAADYVWQKVELYNINGQVVLSLNNAENNKTIDMHEFKTGVYILKATTTSGLILSEKIIKQ